MPSRFRRSFAASRFKRRQLLLAHFLVIGRLLDLFDILQAADALADRGEIRQRAAEPALVHIKLSASLRRFLDRFLRLLLATDEKNLPAAPRHFLEKISRALQLLHRLIEIDDVDLVALLENERLHLRIPALGLVTKMDACFEQFGN